MSLQPFLNVITVTKNDFSRLKITAKSLAKLSNEVNWLIRNGGNPFTDEEIQELKNSSKKEFLLFEGEDKGIYDAMNRALLDCNDFSQSRNESAIVWFLNCGDQVGEEFDEIELYESWDSRSALIMRLENSLEYGPNVTSVQELNDVELLKGLANGQIRISHQAFLVSLSTLLKVGAFKTRYLVAADFALILQIAEQVKFVQLQNCTVVCEQNGFSQTHSIRAEMDRIIFLLGRGLFRFSRINIKAALLRLRLLFKHFLKRLIFWES